MFIFMAALAAYALFQNLLKTSAGNDLQACVMGGDFVGDTGTSSTAPTATTFTADGKSYTTNALIGHVVQRAGTYGVILSNTATVLTIDKWHDPTNEAGAAAATPAAGQYVILPGGQPAYWMAVTENATAPAIGDTALAGELTAFGFARIPATYSHTAGAASYALAKTFVSSDATTRTLQKIGVFNASNNGRMLFETAIPSPPVLVSGDSVAITDTVQI